MLQRVLFGVAGFAFVLLALFVFPPAVLEIGLALLCALATYELLGSTRLVRSPRLLALSALVSLCTGLNQTGFMRAQPLHGFVALMLTILLLLGAFAELLRRHKTTEAYEVLCCFFGALFLPELLLSLTRIFQMENGALLVLMPLLAAWGSDTFALFAGMLFGKHKLAPVVSPKKTIEGAAGGVLGAVFCMLVFTALCNQFAGLALPYPAAVLLGAAGSVIGQVGDLSFSIIKRKTKIKDYGSIFPGHGGVLDRFDSVIFVAPVVEAILLVIGA